MPFASSPASSALTRSKVSDVNWLIQIRPTPSSVSSLRTVSWLMRSRTSTSSSSDSTPGRSTRSFALVPFGPRIFSTASASDRPFSGCPFTLSKMSPALRPARSAGEPARGVTTTTSPFSTIRTAPMPVNAPSRESEYRSASPGGMYSVYGSPRDSSMPRMAPSSSCPRSAPYKWRRSIKFSTASSFFRSSSLHPPLSACPGTSVPDPLPPGPGRAHSTSNSVAEQLAKAVRRSMRSNFRPSGRNRMGITSKNDSRRTRTKAPENHLPASRARERRGCLRCGNRAARNRFISDTARDRRVRRFSALQNADGTPWPCRSCRPARSCRPF